MDATSNPNRRRFLALTGLGTAGLAGCADRLDNDDSTESADPDSMSGETRTVTILVQPDPTALREAQTAIVNDLEDGEYDDQEEAEQELAARERELIAAAINDARAQIEAAGAVHVDTVEAEGSLLVEGDADDILDLLEAPLISAVLSESRFEMAKQREAAGETGTETDSELPDDADNLEDDDSEHESE